MIKWGGAVVTVLLVALWIASNSFYWYRVYIHPRKSHLTPITVIGLQSGRLILCGDKIPRPMPPGWHDNNDRLYLRFAHQHVHMDWIPKLFVDSDRHSHNFDVAIPIWMLALPTLLLTAAAWRLDILARRRARVGLCVKCGYSRAGLAAGAVCPECGDAPRAAANPG